MSSNKLLLLPMLLTKRYATQPASATFRSVFQAFGSITRTDDRVLFFASRGRCFSTTTTTTASSSSNSGVKPSNISNSSSSNSSINSSVDISSSVGSSSAEVAGEKPRKLTPEEVEAESEKNLERLMRENFKGDVDPDIVLYKGDSEFLVRMLFGTATFNLVYWTQYLVYAAFNNDVLINGIPVAGEMKWGYLGLVGTTVMYAMNIYMSRYTIRRVYYPASNDPNRVGFQMYNIFGLPGKKIETELGNTKMWKVRTDKDEHLIRIGGFDRNLLLAEKAGPFTDKLMDILNRPNKYEVPVDGSDWRKKVDSKRKHK